jgi:hypothetical protein
VHSPVVEFFDNTKKYICLLDDNVLGYSNWRNIFEQLQLTDKRFQFKQGMDLRILTEEKAQVISSSKTIGDIIFAFDNYKDKDVIQDKLQLWHRYSNRIPKLYVLCAYESIDIHDVIRTFERVVILMKNRSLPYIMRYENYNQSEFRGIYITLARWCNQPSLFKKMSFREFCEKDGGSALRYMQEFEKKYPQVSRDYFDIKWVL